MLTKPTFVREASEIPGSILWPSVVQFSQELVGDLGLGDYSSRVSGASMLNVRAR